MNGLGSRKGRNIQFLKEKLKKFPAFLQACLKYAGSLKEDQLGVLERQVEEAASTGRLEGLEAKLVDKTIEGVKPDAYLLVRGGKLVVDYSYHFFRKMVFQKYGTELDVILLDAAAWSSIKRIDPVNHTVEFDLEAFSSAYLGADEFDLGSFKGALVHSTCEKGSKTVLYRVGDLWNACSTYNSASFSLDAPKRGAKKHKEMMMIYKTAIRYFIRQHFVDLDTEDEVEEAYSENLNAPEEMSPEDIQYFREKILSAQTDEEYQTILKELKAKNIQDETARKILIEASRETKTRLTTEAEAVARAVSAPTTQHDEVDHA